MWVGPVNRADTRECSLPKPWCRCECHDLESTTDYRMLAEVSRGRRTYLTPLGEETAKQANGALARSIASEQSSSRFRILQFVLSRNCSLHYLSWQIDEFFIELSKGGHTTSLALALRGRTVTVPRAASHAAIARFKFDELCGRPLGAEDYLGIASAFHTVFVEDVPQLTRNDINRVSDKRIRFLKQLPRTAVLCPKHPFVRRHSIPLRECTQVRRLITLVDAFYDKKVRLIVSAQVWPDSFIYMVDTKSKHMAAQGHHKVSSLRYPRCPWRSCISLRVMPATSLPRTATSLGPPHTFPTRQMKPSPSTAPFHDW
eukprot:scaffold78458_cov32-Tisochrysis_lutea.AAC.3